jgi:arylsulfatase A-like enzyme
MSMGALERRVREQGASARRQLRPPLRLLYDGEIRRTDDALRALFEDFGIGEREVVVVTSDHGEAFFEHGVLGHGSRLFEEQLRVPLLVRLPGGAGAGRVELPVSGLDVLPTVLEAVGSEADPALPGRSLLGAASQPLPEVPVFFELMRRGESAEGVRLGRWKLYRRLEPSVLPSLYDVEGDRGETMDRRGAAAEASERLAGVLDAWNVRWPVFAAPRTALPVSEEEVEKLEALGYGS